MNIKKLGIEDENLTLSSFSHQDALDIGLKIISLAKKDNVHISVHIEKNRVPIFTYLMDNTTEENYEWMHRKKRVVDHYQKNSAFIGDRFERLGIKHCTHSLLDPQYYQAVGGSIPIHVQGVGMIGTLTVSGLTSELDHFYAVKGIELFLKDDLSNTRQHFPK